MKIQGLTPNHQFLRSEFDWIAIDSKNEVGYFCSAGFGPIPTKLCEANDPLEGIEHAVLSIRHRSEILVEIHQPEWKEIGKRGIHVYDWSSKTREYVRVIEPLHPFILAKTDEKEMLRFGIKIEMEFQK